MSVNSDTNLNAITNKLLLKYDQNFENNYITTGLLDKGIMSKEELIVQNIDNANKKDKTISVLVTTILLVIIYFALFTMNATGKLPGKTLMIISVFLFLFYLFYIYYYIIKDPSDALSKYSVAVADELKSKIGTLIGIENNYQCPTGCPISEEEEGYGVIQNLPVPVLNRQSSANVWLNGDTSVNNPYPEKYNQQNVDLRPQPFFSHISKNGATYYQCDFKVPSTDPNFSGIPMNGKNNLFTTIPCSEMSGYKESGRYICSSDTNSNIKSEMDPTSSSFNNYLSTNCVKVL